MYKHRGSLTVGEAREVMYQKSLLQTSSLKKEPCFPPTKFMGSKRNLMKFIFENLADLKYDTVLDAFSGSGVVAYEFKRNKKQVTTNDFLHFAYLTSKALIENNKVKLDNATFEKLLIQRPDAPNFTRKHYSGLFLAKKESYFLDSLWANINELNNGTKKPLRLRLLVELARKKDHAEFLRSSETRVGTVVVISRSVLKNNLQTLLVYLMILFLTTVRQILLYGVTP